MQLAENTVHEALTDYCFLRTFLIKPDSMKLRNLAVQEVPAMVRAAESGHSTVCTNDGFYCYMSTFLLEISKFDIPQAYPVPR